MNPLDRCPFKPAHGHIQSFDMLDPHARENPHAFNAWLLADPNRRVYQPPFEKSFYVVHRYDDVKFVLTNSKLFSSAILPTRRSPFLALMDGSDHLRIREIINQIFQIDSEKFPQESIRQFITQTTNSFTAQPSASVFDDWATVIPLASIATVLGLPLDKKNLLQLHQKAIAINRALFVLGGTGERRSSDPSWKEKISISMQLLKSTPSLIKLGRAIGLTGLGELKQMFIPVKSDWENPRPNFKEMPQGLASLLALMLIFNEALSDKANQSTGMVILRQSIADGKLSRVEAIMLCTFILFAGYETSVSLLSNCLAHLASDIELLNKLKANNDRIGLFVEEALRFYTPVGRFLRRANEDVTIGDQVIPQGAMVIALLTAANTDPDRFEDPFTFQSDRQKNNHISFGKGLHFCVGAPLARFQAVTAITQLVNQVSHITIDSEKKLKWVTDRDNGILRYEDLWVKFSR